LPRAYSLSQSIREDSGVCVWRGRGAVDSLRQQKGDVDQMFALKCCTVESRGLELR
jgi:hypothetical protein